MAFKKEGLLDGTMRMQPVRLADLIEHPTLFKMYPMLENVNVVFEKLSSGGYWDRTKNLIVVGVSAGKPLDSYIGIILHEVQHAVQYWEAFNNGASPEEYPISTAAIDKTLAFLDSNKGQPLKMGGKDYTPAEIKFMSTILTVLKNNYGTELDRANAVIDGIDEAFGLLNAEVGERNRAAKDAWRAGNHPEAVNYRKLNAARMELGRQKNDYSVTRTPEEQAQLNEDFRAAAAASMAQYKYNEGLLDTGMVTPDISDLLAEKDRLTKEYLDAIAFRKRIATKAKSSGAPILMYYLTAGEVEARDAAARRNMPPEQRVATPPYVRDVFGDLRNMINVGMRSNVASAPPMDDDPILDGLPKLTKAQVRYAKMAAGARRQAADAFQKKIVRSRRASEMNSDISRLVEVARSGKEARRLLKAFSDTLKPASLKVLLPALPTEDITRMVGDRLRGIGRINKLIESITVYRMRKINKLADEAAKWVAFNSKFEEGGKALGDVMIASTFYQVDPTKAPSATAYMRIDDKLQKLIADKAAVAKIEQRRREIRAVYDGGEVDGQIIRGYNELDKPELGGGKAKAIYRMARDAYKANFEEHYDLLLTRIADTTDEGDAATKAKSFIEQMFEDARKQIVYFPLMRYGQYWFSVGKGTNSEFYTFETATARNLALSRRQEELKAAGSTSETNQGDSIRKLREIVTGADASVKLKQIFETLDSGNFNDIDTLKDHVFQMYLLSLPEADMRGGSSRPVSARTSCATSS